MPKPVESLDKFIDAYELKIRKFTYNLWMSTWEYLSDLEQRYHFT